MMVTDNKTEFLDSIGWQVHLTWCKGRIYMRAIHARCKGANWVNSVCCGLALSAWCWRRLCKRRELCGV